MLKTITGNKEELASQIGLSYSGLDNTLPRNFFNQAVKGEGGKKDYCLLAQQHFRFRSLLAASPRLSSTGVKKLLQSRQRDFDRIKEQWSVSMKTFLQNHPRGVDEDLHSYTIADLELLGRCISTMSCLLPRPDEMDYLEGGPDRSNYIQGLASLLDEMEDDVEQLLGKTTVSMTDECAVPFREALTAARQSLAGHLSDKPSRRAAFSVSNLIPLIGRVHYTNTPYLWKDILSAMGHKEVKITDGSGDGNRDVESTFQGISTLTQVKTVRAPIGEEVVRQFASTCRTYTVPQGYFVTTLRFARDAHLGQWPQLSSDRKAELRQYYASNTTYHARMVEEMCRQVRIAEIELVDGQALASYAYKYRIGAALDVMIDETYWDTLTIPGFRRRTPAYNPLPSLKRTIDQKSRDHENPPRHDSHRRRIGETT